MPGNNLTESDCMSSKKKNAYIISVDVGTTNILAHVYSSDLRVLGKSVKSVVQRHPTTSRYELDPEELWTVFQDVVKESIQHSNLTVHDMTCLGISVQRNSFLLWSRETGKAQTPVITWQDLRAAADVKEWNSSMYMKLLQAAENGELCVGCLESWLLWKLTNGRLFATDYSCASAFGFYDPFTCEWSKLLMKMLKIPEQLLPEVRDTSGDFSCTYENVFGSCIPIRCLIGDQQAATVAECCFSPGQVKVTWGTGSFINLNTGSKAHASVKGMYPTIGWKIGDRVTYIAEGNHRDTGTTVDWLKSIRKI